MKDRTFNRNINEHSSVSAPHFDDERTLLSARKVVPLEKIEKKVIRRRRWFLGGAFATAMLLGAASALVTAYVRLRNTETPATEITQVEETPAPVATEQTVTDETQQTLPASLEEAENFEEPVAEPPRRAP